MPHTEDVKSTAKIDVLGYLQRETAADAKRTNVIMQELPDHELTERLPIKESSKLPFVAAEKTVAVNLANIKIKISTTEIVSFEEFLRWRIINELRKTMFVDFPVGTQIPEAEIQALRVFPLGEQASPQARTKGNFRPHYDITTSDYNLYFRFFFKNTDQPDVFEAYSSNKEECVHNPNDLNRLTLEMADVTIAGKDLADRMMQKLAEAKDPALNKIAANLNNAKLLSIVVPFQIKDFQHNTFPAVPIKFPPQTLKFNFPRPVMQDMKQKEIAKTAEAREKATKEFIAGKQVPAQQAEAKAEVKSEQNTHLMSPWILQKLGKVAKGKAPALKKVTDLLNERQISAAKNTEHAAVSVCAAAVCCMDELKVDGINKRSQLDVTQAQIKRESVAVQGRLTVGKPFGVLLDAAGVVDLSREITEEQVKTSINSARQGVAANYDYLTRLAANKNQAAANDIKAGFLVPVAGKTDALSALNQLCDKIIAHAEVIAKDKSQRFYHHAIILVDFINNYKKRDQIVQNSSEEIFMDEFRCLFINLNSLTPETGFYRFVQQHWLLKAMVSFNLFVQQQILAKDKHNVVARQQRNLLEQAHFQLQCPVAVLTADEKNVPAQFEYIHEQPNFKVFLDKLKKSAMEVWSKPLASGIVTNIDEYQCARILIDFIESHAAIAKFGSVQSYIIRTENKLYNELVKQLRYIFLNREALSGEEAFRIFLNEGTHLLEGMAQICVVYDDRDYESRMQTKRCVVDAMSKLTSEQWTSGVYVEFESTIGYQLREKINSALLRKNIACWENEPRFTTLYNANRQLHAKALECIKQELSTDDKAITTVAAEFKNCVNNTYDVASTFKTLQEDIKRSKRFKEYTAANPKAADPLNIFTDQLLHAAIQLDSLYEDDSSLHGAAQSYLMSLPKAETDVIEQVITLEETMQIASQQNKGAGLPTLTFCADGSTKVTMKSAAADNKEVAAAKANPEKVIHLRNVLKQLKFAQTLSVAPLRGVNANTAPTPVLKL